MASRFASQSLLARTIKPTPNNSQSMTFATATDFKEQTMTNEATLELEPTILPDVVETATKPTMKWTHGDNTLLLLAMAIKVLVDTNHPLSAQILRNEIGNGDVFKPWENYLSFIVAKGMVEKFVTLT